MVSISDFSNSIPLSTTVLIDISESTTISVAADLGGCTLVGIITPAALTGTALSFQGSADNSTFVAVQDGAGSAISKTVAASNYIPIDPKDFYGIRFIKVVSGSAEAADRTITLIAKAI